MEKEAFADVCFKKGKKRGILQAAHSLWPYAEQSGKV